MKKWNVSLKLKMKIKDRFKRWFKLRFAILYPFGTFLVFFANSDDRSIMVGIWLIIAGLLLRAWSNGYAIKLEKLTTSGPYAFVRHPLYLGTMLLAIGFIIMLKIYYIGVLFLFIMAAVYYQTIINEERMLEQKFKHLYVNYVKKVPIILPAISPYREGEKWPFSFKRLMKSKEYKLFIWVIVMVIAFHLKDEFLVEHERIDTRIIGFIIAAFSLGVVDLISELMKRKDTSAN